MVLLSSQNLFLSYSQIISQKLEYFKLAILKIPIDYFLKVLHLITFLRHF